MSQNIQQHNTRIDRYKSERLTPINRYLLVEPTTIFLERLYVIQSKNRTSVMYWQNSIVINVTGKQCQRDDKTCKLISNICCYTLSMMIEIHSRALQANRKTE